MRSPVHQPIARHMIAVRIIGNVKSPMARRKLSKRKPRSRAVSPRKRCDLIERTNAKPIGNAAEIIVQSTATEASHSAMKIDETTDAISHPARARLPTMSSTASLFFSLGYSIELISDCRLSLKESQESFGSVRCEIEKAFLSIGECGGCRQRLEGEHRLALRARLPRAAALRRQNRANHPLRGLPFARQGEIVH